jgi:serine/threonine-protein kinase RsbT
LTVDQADTLEIRTSDDVVRVRQQVRARAIKAGLSLVDQTKLVTAASELARNTLDHAGGGRVAMHMIEDGTRQGLRLVFEDQGPGIPDIQLALKDGYTTGTGLGLGLSGSRRLCNEFSVESTVGVGTKITIARWK